MTILRQLEKRGADPTLPWGSSFIPTNGMTGMVAAGVAMNDDTALSIGTVASCMRILCDAVSTLPLTSYRTVADPSSPAGILKQVKNVPPLVQNPWPEGGSTRQDWLAQVMFSLLLRGNFFGQVCGRDDRGFPTLVKPLHPDSVMARRDPSTGQRLYRVNGTLMANPDDMVHIPSTLTPPGGFIGMNPVEYQRGAWGLAAASERYGGQFYQNSANPSGVVTVPGDLSEDEALALARQWGSVHAGVANGGKPAVLTGGATWAKVSLSQEDMQFLQTRDFQRHEIATWFGVPEHMLGFQDRTSSWGTGIEQMEIGFVINTLMPWLARIEGRLSNLIPDNQLVKFDLSGRLRGDTLQRFQAYTLARNGSWMNVDEIRASENLPPLPDGKGQDYWAPLNFAPIDQAAKPPSPDGATGGIGGGIDQSPDAPAPGAISQ